MRYHSGDHNCLIDTIDDARDVDDRLLADITVVYPSLVESRVCETSKTVVLVSKSSRMEICSITLPDGYTDVPGDLRLERMPQTRVKLLDDAILDSDSVGPPTSLFGVKLPSCGTLDDLAGVEQLHPDIESRLLHLVTQRKRQDEHELREFIRKKKAAFEDFEAAVNADAAALSALAMSSTIESRGDPEDQDTSSTTSRSKLHQTTNSKGPRRLSINSMHSSSSASSDKPRKKSGRHGKRADTRSATAPGPKPAIIMAVRKSSLSETKKDGLPAAANSKRVMFSEQEPTRIDSAHALDPSDAEDDPVEHEDLFDMDETIPVVPIASQVPSPVDIPGTASLEIPSQQRVPFGRQEDTGLSGSFRVRSLNKYDPMQKSPEEFARPQWDISDVEASPFATSLPRDIGMSHFTPTVAPLSSVKHLTALSPTQADLESDPLGSLGDSPPAGMSRKTMWTKAVASSLRMSGLALPTMNKDEIETSITSTRQSLRS